MDLSEVILLVDIASKEKLVVLRKNYSQNEFQNF